MASVYQKRGTWYLSYKDERGRWKCAASSVRTKGEARRLADDCDRRAERVRKGLEAPLVSAGERTIGDIVTWWLETIWIGRPSYAKAKSAIRRHVLTAPFAIKRPQDVTPAEIEHHLEAKQRIPGKKGKPLGAQSLNHLREFFRQALKAAIGERLMPGPNPIDSVKRWVVPKRLSDFLRFHEVPLVLAAVRPRWSDLFATAIYAGLRKGELFGLRKTDVDLEIGAIMVKRSYDRVTTKGKRSDAIPAAAPAPDPVAFSTRFLPDAPEGGSEAHAGSTGPSEIPVLTWGRDIGFEPTTFSLGRSAASVGGGSKTLQAAEKIENRSESDSQSAPPEAPVSRVFVSGVCLENRLKTGGGDASDRLLSVKQVAQRLSVTTATVYGLCAAGRLPHVRILNVIRIAPSDLAAFITSCRVGNRGGHAR